MQKWIKQGTAIKKKVIQMLFKYNLVFLPGPFYTQDLWSIDVAHLDCKRLHTCQGLNAYQLYIFLLASLLFPARGHSQEVLADVGQDLWEGGGGGRVLAMGYHALDAELYFLFYKLLLELVYAENRL